MAEIARHGNAEDGSGVSGFAFIVQTITFNCQSSPLTPDDPEFKPPLVGFPERSGWRVEGGGIGAVVHWASCSDYICPLLFVFVFCCCCF